MVVNEEALEAAPHCALTAASHDGPVAGAAPFWWDGAGLWVSGTPATRVAQRLRADPRVAAYVAPTGRELPGVGLRGRARVHGLHDPVGLALYGPAVGAALSALALKHAPLLLTYALDLPRLPPSTWPAGFVLVHIEVDEAWSAAQPEPPAGMGPALPSAVPPPVRRALSGRRDAALACLDPNPQVVPVTLSAGMRLDGSDAAGEGTRAAVILDAGRLGLVLEGTVRDRCLTPDHARWWQGLVTGAAKVSPRVPGGITLPD